MSNVLVINMQDRGADCHLCGGDATGMHYGVPMHNGCIVPNDWPLTWSGVTVCRDCFDLQGTLLHPMTQEAFQMLRKKPLTPPRAEE